MNAVCNLSVISVRREPSDRSEQVTQLLFGETAEITGKQENWFKIKTTYDDYTGWVDKKQLVQVNVDCWNEITSSKSYLTSDLLQLAIWNKSQICPIVIGSALPCYNANKFKIADTEYTFEGGVVDTTEPHPTHIQEQAYMYLNSPYQWGGRSPFGIDCSGFTQMVYKLCGIKLKRDANQQAEQGEIINFVEESRVGDLAFFNNPDGKIVHVGIVLPSNQIIHASGKVRIDKIDHEGIFNVEMNTYSHKLRFIKRII